MSAECQVTATRGKVMDEYILCLMLMAFGILCCLSGYAFGYAERDNAIESARDRAYDQWLETKYTPYEIATGAADDEAFTDWSNWSGLGRPYSREELDQAWKGVNNE